MFQLTMDEFENLKNNLIFQLEFQDGVERASYPMSIDLKISSFRTKYFGFQLLSMAKRCLSSNDLIKKYFLKGLKPVDIKK